MAALGMDILLRRNTLSPALADVAKKSDDARASMEKMRGASRAIDDVGKASSRLEVAQRKAADAAGKVRVAEAQLESLRKRGKADVSQMVRAEENLARAQRGLVSAQKDVADSSKAVKRAQDAVNHRRETAEIADKARKYARLDNQIDKVGRSMRGLAGRGVMAAGFGLAAAGAGIAVGFTKAVQKAGDFDKTMRTVGATLGEGQQKVEGLTDLAIEMGAKTSFSAKGASDAMLELARGGLTSAQIEAGALQHTLTLATAGGLELGEAATYMVSGLTAFNLKASQAGRVASALAGGANASTASVQSMGYAFQAASASAAAAGLSIEDTAAAIAALANNGIQGSDAGTSLKTMLASLQPASAVTREAMKKLGLVTKESGNQFFTAKGEIKSMTEIAGLLSDATKDLTNQERTRLLRLAFGSDAVRAALILAKEGEAGLRTYTKATKNQAAADELAKTATEGYSGAVERFQGALETLQIIGGKTFLPGVTTALTSISDWAEDHQDDITEGMYSFAESAIYAGEAIQVGGSATLVILGNVMEAVGNLTNATTYMLKVMAPALRAFANSPFAPSWAKDLSNAVDGLYATADSAIAAGKQTAALGYSLDTKMTPAFRNARQRIQAMHDQQVVSRTQREAVAGFTTAVARVGKVGKLSKDELATFNRESLTGTARQLHLKTRLDEARKAFVGQYKAAQTSKVGHEGLNKVVKTSRERLEAELLALGFSKEAAHKYAVQITKVPTKKKTEYDDNTNEAKRRTKLLHDEVDNVPKRPSIKWTVDWDTRVDSINTRLVKSAGRWAFQAAVAEGGPIPGFGPKGKDSVPILAAPGEHMWTAQEVDKVGGHQAMLRMRKAAAAGQLQGFALGGEIRPYASAVGGGGTEAASREGNAAVKRALRAAAELGGMVGFGSHKLMQWHGGTFTERFINTLKYAQRLAGIFMPVMQGGFRPRTSYSGTSHAGDAIDTAYSGNLLRGLRAAGVAAWFRGPWVGMPYHIHGVPLPGRGYGGGSAIWQAQDYLRGGNGLYRGGVASRPGFYPLAEKGPERVLTTGQNRNFERLVGIMDRRGGAASTTIIINAPNYV